MGCWGITAMQSDDRLDAVGVYMHGNTCQRMGSWNSVQSSSPYCRTNGTGHRRSRMDSPIQVQWHWLKLW